MSAPDEKNNLRFIVVIFYTTTRKMLALSDILILVHFFEVGYLNTKFFVLLHVLTAR